MEYSFAQVEDLVARLPITRDNFFVFEELLRQPYDIYRPVLDMLFDETIVVEDLMPAGGALQSPNEARVMVDSIFAEMRASLSEEDFREDVFKARVQSLVSGIRSGATVSRDTTSLHIDSSGAPIPSYVPTPDFIVGNDTNTMAPNPIEISRVGVIADAQKLLQQQYAAASKRIE